MQRPRRLQRMWPRQLLRSTPAANGMHLHSCSVTFDVIGLRQQVMFALYSLAVASRLELGAIPSARSHGRQTTHARSERCDSEVRCSYARCVARPRASEATCVRRRNQRARRPCAQRRRSLVSRSTSSIPYRGCRSATHPLMSSKMVTSTRRFIGSTDNRHPLSRRVRTSWRLRYHGVEHRTFTVVCKQDQRSQGCVWMSRADCSSCGATAENERVVRLSH